MSTYERFDGASQADRSRCFAGGKVKKRTKNQSNNPTVGFSSTASRWSLDWSTRERYDWNAHYQPINLTRPLSSRTSHSTRQPNNSFDIRSSRFTHKKYGPGPADIVPNASSFNHSINHTIKQSVNERRIQTAPSIPSKPINPSNQSNEPINPCHEWPRPSSMYGSFAQASRTNRIKDHSNDWPSAGTYDPNIQSIKPSINQSSAVVFSSLVERKIHDDKTWIPASWDYSTNQPIIQTVGHSIKGTIGQANVHSDRLSFTQTTSQLTPGPGKYSVSQSINKSSDSRHPNGPAYSFTHRLPSMIEQSAHQSGAPLGLYEVSKPLGDTHSKHYNSHGGWV